MLFKHALVTGGLGFIGSAITEALENAGTNVVVVDSLVQNVVPVDYFSSYTTRVRVIPESVATFLASNTRIDDFDVVIHAASMVGPAGILRYAGRIAPDIVTATSMLVDGCLASNVPLVYFSSAEVYGKNGPLHEDDDIRVPPKYNARIEYALAKLTSESIVLNSVQRGLRSIVLRPFNVAGARQSRAGGFVLPTFVQQALSDQPLTVFENGDQVRAFLGLQDLVSFVCDVIHPDLFNDRIILNLGNPENATTIADLAKRVVAHTGTGAPILYTNGKAIHGESYEEAESFTKVPDINRALSLGWAPTKALDDIISDTISFYRKRNIDKAKSHTKVRISELGLDNLPACG